MLLDVAQVLQCKSVGFLASSVLWYIRKTVENWTKNQNNEWLHTGFIESSVLSEECTIEDVLWHVCNSYLSFRQTEDGNLPRREIQWEQEGRAWIMEHDTQHVHVFQQRVKKVKCLKHSHGQPSRVLHTHRLWGWIFAKLPQISSSAGLSSPTRLNWRDTAKIPTLACLRGQLDTSPVSCSHVARVPVIFRVSWVGNNH